MSQAPVVGAMMAANELFAAGASRYCLPSQPCFPSFEAFASLNQTLQGRLQFQPQYPDCTAGQNGLERPCNNAEWRTRQPGATQYINFQ